MKKKLMCTLGPTSLNKRVIRRLDELNVDLFRLNLSHTPIDQLEDFVRLIRANSGIPISFDSQGAQVRTGNLSAEPVQLKSGAVLNLVPVPQLCEQKAISLYPPEVFPQLNVGDLVSIDFGGALLQVIKTVPEFKARVLSSGIVGANKAVSIIDHTPVLPNLTEIDRAAFRLGKKLGIQHVALSFASSSRDVEELRALVGDQVQLIAKIESRFGLRNLNDILRVADVILIDRGDLSREVPSENIPYIQKDIIRHANAAGVPVYVATNLLESMIEHAHPTRAEVNDVINTLVDGADGLVLAAETAIGKHPVASVTTIQSLMHRFDPHATVALSEEQWQSKSLLIEPHGGKLVERLISHIDREDIHELPRWEVDDYVMMDVKQICVGSFSPLEGFMNRHDLQCVLEKNELSDGTKWSMPILCQIPPNTNFPYGVGDTVALSNGGVVFAVLQIEDLYQYDIDKLAQEWFGTTDPNHPGVARICSGGDKFIGGNVDLTYEESRSDRPYELTPMQSRLIFTHNQWQRVVGFHTRNVPHRAHEYLQRTAVEEYDCDGIFIHPINGPKKPGDFTDDTILQAYQSLVEKHYPSNLAVIGTFGTYPRYAGPREALFTALCRKNFGCSHFIVGRDHTGVGAFYASDGARRLFDATGDIGIQPIFFEEVYYCSKCAAHLEWCEHGKTFVHRISGTEMRESLIQDKMLPNWYVRESVSRTILEAIEKQQEVFYPSPLSGLT